jgi:tetratricopeptide (TPR) repeat protein
MNAQLCKFLRSREYVAEALESGAEALQLLRNYPVDVVMVDTDLPDGGALELSHGLRKLSSPPKLVLMVSSKTEFEALELFSAEGQLLKPFMGRQLIVMLEGLAKMRESAASRPARGRAVVSAPAAVVPAVSAPAVSAPAGSPAGSQRSASAAVIRPARQSPMVRAASEAPASPVEQAPKIPLQHIPERDLGAAQVDLSKLSKLLVGGGGGGVSARPVPMRTIMHQAGNLDKTPFSALLYKLFANQSTGSLGLQGAGSRTLFFLNGEPVWAVSEVASESLGAVMVQLGYVEMEELNHVMDRFVGEMPLGRALLESNLVDSEQLLHGLDRQVYERVLGCFALKAGRYIFTEGDDWLGEVRRFPQNPIQLISDGVERNVGPNVLAQHLQPHLNAYVVRTEKFEWFEPHFPVSERSREALDLIRGDKTLNDLTRTGVIELMGLLRLVWSLHQADMVDFSATPRTTAERSKSKPPLPQRKPTDPDMRVFARTAPSEHTRDEREKLARKVMSYYMRLGHDDNWKLLGVERDVRAEELKRAFEAAMGSLPAERLSILSEALQEKAGEVKEALQRAYRVLSEPTSRQGYAERLQERQQVQERARQQRSAARSDFGPGPEGGSQVIAARALEEAAAKPLPAEPPRPHNTQETTQEIEQNQALVAIRRARYAAREGLWKDAWRAIKLASDYDPYNQEILVLKTWIAYNLPHEDKARQGRVCRTRLEDAISVDESIAEAHYYLGRIKEDQQDLMEALKSYRTALALEPNFEEAKKGADRLRRQPMIMAAVERAAQEAQEEQSLVDRLKGLFRK